MGKIRLWNYPEETKDVIAAVLSGASDQKQIAEKIGCSKNTVRNKLHDPRYLEFIDRVEEEYIVLDGAREIIQLDDYSLLKDRFSALPGVETVFQKLEEEEELTFENIGRVISFETESGAAKDETFVHYGRIYANWFDFLGMGTKSGNLLLVDADRKEDSDRSNRIDAGPKNVLSALRIIGDSEDTTQLAEKLGFSESYTSNILATMYALNLADYDRRTGFEKTEYGLRVSSASIGKKKELLRERLINVPVIRAYVNLVPDGEFKHHDIIQKISDEYFLGWSGTTVDTVSKRTYRWLIYVDMLEEIKRGTVRARETLRQTNTTMPSEL